MPTTKRFFENLTPGQRDAEIWEELTNISGGLGVTTGNKSAGQPREVTFDDAPFVQLEDIVCSGVVILNDTGKTVAVKRGSGTVFYEIPNGMGRRIDVELNANELSIKNLTDSATVTLTYEIIGEAV